MDSGAKSPTPQWERWELELIQRPGLTPKQLLPLLPLRTRSAIETRRKKLGFRAGIFRQWHDWEIRVIEENPALTSRALASLLPGRSVSAIHERRRKLQLRRRPWLGSEIKLLKAAVATHTDRELANLFGRSLNAVHGQRYKLHIHRAPHTERVVVPLFWDVRLRAAAIGISLRDLERSLGMMAGTLKPSQRIKKPTLAAARAVEVLGGELYAVWED